MYEPKNIRKRWKKYKIYFAICKKLLNFAEL